MKDKNKIWDELYARESNKWKLETRSFNGVLKGKNVLELGVGNGKTLKSILRDSPKRVSAIDFSENAIEICKKQFFDENIELLQGDAIKMPFEDKKFDCVVCYYLLNNLNTVQRRKVICEIYRVLNENGIVLFEDFARGDFREVKKEKDNGLIKNYFDKDELKKMFGKFRAIRMKIEEFSVIRTDKNIKRKIISAIIKK